MSNGPIVTDHETGEPIDAGCAMHSDHWLAKAVRQNRVGLGLPPQECQNRPGCPKESR